MSGGADGQTVLALTLREDLAAFREAVDREAVNDMIVFANRFLSDASLFTSPPAGMSELTIGTALRVVAEDLAQVKARKPRAELDDELVELAVDFVAQIARALPTLDKDYLKACSAFFKFERGVSLHQQTLDEKAAFEDLQPLNGAARTALAKIVTADPLLFSLPRSMFPEGLLNEFSRLCRVHEFDEKDLCFYTGVKSFQLLNEYYRYLLFPIEGEMERPDREMLNAERAKYVENLVTFVRQLDRVPHGEEWNLTRDLVAPTIRRWREFFVIYMQPQTTQFVPTVVGQGTPEQAKGGPDKGKKTPKR